jgi:hypothetical protein
LRDDLSAGERPGGPIRYRVQANVDGESLRRFSVAIFPACVANGHHLDARMLGQSFCNPSGVSPHFLDKQILMLALTRSRK